MLSVFMTPCMKPTSSQRTSRRRVALMHLIRDLTASDFGGYNMLVTLHGEGSLEAQLLGAYRDADIDGMKALVVRALAP